MIHPSSVWPSPDVPCFTRGVTLGGKPPGQKAPTPIGAAGPANSTPSGAGWSHDRIADVVLRRGRGRWSVRLAAAVRGSPHALPDRRLRHRSGAHLADR